MGRPEMLPAATSQLWRPNGPLASWDIQGLEPHESDFLKALGGGKIKVGSPTLSLLPAS